MLTPSSELAPFNWPNPNRSHYLNYQVDFKQVNPSLRARAVDWLIRFIEFVKGWPAEKIQIDPEWPAEVLDAYNKYILQLLVVLPAEDNQAETLFQYFSINDPTPWADSEDSSGYNPLYNLWKNPLINERWKKAADQEMRQIIKNELQGKSFPRQPYESALKCYARHLQFILDEKGHLPYSKEFFADQIRFLASLEVSDQNLFKPWKVAPILNILAGEEYLDLRHKFIRFVLLRDGNFSIFSEETEKSAQMVLKEFGNDSQIFREVSDQLRTYQDQNEAIKQRAEEGARAKEALLAPMRKPVNPVYNDAFSGID